jgi:hypothetical protein
MRVNNPQQYHVRDIMVRFTLKDNMTEKSIRMELSKDEPLNEIKETVRDYWGLDNILLAVGYRLLPAEGTVGDSISEGDEVNVLPNLWDLGKV